MENLEKSVYVLGFPQGLNKFKVKLFVEKQIGAGVKSVEKEGNLAIITFENFDDLRRFQNSEIKNINFGGSVHDLRILSNHEDKDIQQEPHHESLPGPLSARVHGNSSNKIIKQERKLLDCVSQETLFNKVHYWSDLPVLPAPEGTQCVLAQNISPSNSIQKMTLHFQNKRRNGGGPIKCFIQMVDGLLVVFNDIKHSESCLHTINQSLDGKKISIFRKVIPEYYTNKFVLEVIGESKTVEHETLELYLESCSPNETSPTACNEQEKSGVYLIEYGDDYDYSETEELLQKIHSKPLEGKSLKAAPLLKTDCLKVIGVTSDISNDAMRLQFESRKRTNGGPVTRIDRLKTQSALVYFCSNIVAGRVYQKVGGDMKIRKHPVKIELYHHSISNDHNDNIIINFQQTSSHQQESNHVPEDQLGLFLLKPSCDEAIFHFISGNRSHAEKLRQIFINIAEVKFMSQPDLQLEFTPLKDRKESEENFNKYCEEGVNKFLSEYATVSHTFERSKLERARSYNLYPEIEQIYRRKSNDDDVVICWQTNEPVVQITGLKASVDQMSEKIKNWANILILETASNENQFRIYSNCGVIEELRDMFPNIDIKCDATNYCLVITGSEAVVHDVHVAALTKLNEIDKQLVTGLSESISNFLLTFLAQIYIRLQEKFNIAGIKGVFELDGEKLYLRVKPKEDFNKVIDIIKRSVIVHEINTDKEDSETVKGMAWGRFLQSLQKEFYGIINIKPNEKIILIGLSEELKLLSEKIMNFFDENSIRTFVLKMAYGNARFIVEQSIKFSKQACETKRIECGLSSEENGGMFVQGQKNALDNAISIARNVQKNILEQTHSLNEPGIRKYFLSKDGLKFLASREQLHNCIILTPSCDCEKRDGLQNQFVKKQQLLRKHSTAAEFQESEVASYKLGTVEMSLWKTDILQHKCDVIVNLSNAKLSLLLCGVSGLIKDHDEKNGHKIQIELDKITQKKNGSILPGDAVITSAGNLPACEKIVHAVGPSWTSLGGEPEVILKSCVTNSLQIVEKAGLKSVAIPAISCGVFGGAVSICIPIILDAVTDYFRNTQKSCIEKIHFVENSCQVLLNAFSKYLKAKSQQPKTPSSGPKVHLVQGDIVSSKADVIVDARIPASVTDMKNGSVVSKALALKAGPSVQQQCSQFPQPHDLGKVFETDGGGLSCKKIYHALVTYYDANKSKAIMESIVSECLKMAEKAQYNSIVFPAIATGGFRHPPQLVAKWMMDQIASFSGQYLKKVIIILYPGNDTVINAFNAVFNSSIPRASPSPSMKSQQHNITCVQVLPGDIACFKADVIVNTTSSQSVTDMLNGPVVSSALAKKAGTNVQQQCMRFSPPYHLGNVYETDGGGLSCKKIYHVVITEYDKMKSKSLIETVVSDCLKRAEKARYTSIVFPAIATGGFKHPPNLVATWMKEKILNFSGQYLKTFVILLFPTNQIVINAFNTEFNAPALVGSPQLQQSTTKIMVQLISGDIVSYKADVIVNVQRPQSLTDMKSGSAISKALAQKAGPSVQQQCSKLSQPYTLGNVYETDGGGLSCKKLYHALVTHYDTNTSESVIRSVVSKCLKEADKANYSSIVFPAIATGGFKHPPEMVAKWMRDEISNFSCQHLKTIVILLYPKNQEVINAFTREFTSPASVSLPPPPMLRLVPVPVKPKQSSAGAGTSKIQSKSADENSLTMFIYSTDQKNINDAIKSISEETKKMVHKHTIADAVIPRLTEWEKFEIAEVGKKNTVKLIYTSQSLVVAGLAPDVLKATEAVKEILREFNAAETCSVTWQKKTNKWENYSARSAYILEMAYQGHLKKNNNSSSGDVQVPEFNKGAVRYHTVNISPLFDWTNQSSPTIRRMSKNTSDLPPYWDDMKKGESLTQVELVSGSQEYQNVLKIFQAKGVFYTSIVSIVRIQNTSLYMQYALKKREVTEKLQGFGKAVEQQLFHGTDVGVYVQILTHGFDRNFAGKNGTLFGKGVYFAVNAEYSDEYAEPNDSGEKRMFLADVITGEYCEGNRSMITPPSKKNSNRKNELFDSVVNKLLNPTIFVIFKDASAYPSYLVTYKPAQS